MMGWPVIPSYDLYAGGPAYPLSSLGVRLRAHATSAITVLAGMFDDNPPGGAFDNDSQLRGAEQTGAAFHLGTGALIFSELQYALKPTFQRCSDVARHQVRPAGHVQARHVDRQPLHFPISATTRWDCRSPTRPATGRARMRRRNYSIYAVGDQIVGQLDDKGLKSVALFARIMAAPANRNPIEFGMNIGAVLKAPLPGHGDDSFGISYDLAKVGSSVTQLDLDTERYTGRAESYPHE